MTRDPELLGRLYALRDLLDATIARLEAPPEDCAHPVEHRQYPPGQTMGSAASFTCKLCGKVVTEVQSPSTEDVIGRIVRPAAEGG